MLLCDAIAKEKSAEGLPAKAQLRRLVNMVKPLPTVKHFITSKNYAARYFGTPAGDVVNLSDISMVFNMTPFKIDTTKGGRFINSDDYNFKYWNLLRSWRFMNYGVIFKPSDLYSYCDDGHKHGGYTYEQAKKLYKHAENIQLKYGYTLVDTKDGRPLNAYKVTMLYNSVINQLKRYGFTFKRALV